MNKPVYSLALLVGNSIVATEVRRLLLEVRDFLEAQPEQSYTQAENKLDRGLRGIATKNDLPAEHLFRPLRVVLAGQLASPGLFEIVRCLGKHETLARIDRALRSLSDQAAR
jgi:glutamyl/glutaminyl-tRNA synthetase